MARGQRPVALVTGGAGFIGSHLCERLSDEGMDVVCADNFATGSAANVVHLLDRPGFRLVEADLTEPLDLDGPFGYVFHLASAASPRDYLRLPVETLEAGSLGTRNALALAEAHGARFVLASTSEVYGDPLEYPQREDYWGNVNPVGPRSVYDEAKRYAESLTMAFRRARGTDVGIARIFNSYGPRLRPGDGRVVPTFIRQALDGEPLTVAGGRPPDPVGVLRGRHRGGTAGAGPQRPDRPGQHRQRRGAVGAGAGPSGPGDHRLGLAGRLRGPPHRRPAVPPPRHHPGRRTPRLAAPGAAGGRAAPHRQLLPRAAGTAARVRVGGPGELTRTSPRRGGREEKGEST